MRTDCIKKLNVFAHDTSQMSLIDDEQLVQALFVYGSNPPLRICVRIRSPIGCRDHVKGVPAFIEMMHHYSNEALREQWRDRMMEVDPILADILLQFNFAGIQGIVSWWLKNGTPHSPETMSRYLTTIVSQSMLHFMQQPDIPAEKR